MSFTSISLVQIISVALLGILFVHVRDNTLPSFVVHSGTEGIIVLTGTSSGIGQAAALHFAKRYPNITFYCGVRRAEDGQRLKNIYQESLLSTVGEEVEEYPKNNTHPVILDVTKEEDIQNLVAKVKSSGKPLIGVINNAGVMKNPLRTVEFVDFVEDFKFHFEVNTFGVFRVTQALLPFLRESKGRVLIMSSIFGKMFGSRAAGYISSKHAVEGFADVLRLEVKPIGVSVSVIEPGFLPSEITAKTLQFRREHEECLGETEVECLTYPHLYNEDRSKAADEVMSTFGEMSETCEAMEHAMFASKPKTRYVTSVVGALPAWLLLRIVQFLPDHILDMASKTRFDTLLMTCPKPWIVPPTPNQNLVLRYISYEYGLDK